jgi:hypothetical protein
MNVVFNAIYRQGWTFQLLRNATQEGVDLRTETGFGKKRSPFTS